jgi:hypothetical protein
MPKNNHYPGMTRFAAGMLAGATLLGPLTACSSDDGPEGDTTASPSLGMPEEQGVQCEARQVGQVVLSGEVREAALRGDFPADIDTLNDTQFELIIALVPQDATIDEYNEDSRIFETVLNRLMPPPTVLATRYPVPEIQPGTMNIVTLDIDPGCPLIAPSEAPSKV